MRNGGEDSSNHRDEQANDQQNRGGRAPGARDRRADRSFFFLSEPIAQQKRERRERRRDVIFLAGREAEEEQDHGEPAKQQEQYRIAGFSNAGDAWQPQADLRQSLREERTPGEEPNKQKSVEKNKRNGSVIDGIAFAEIAKELFVDEIEPEEAFSLALRRIAKRRENMPGGRDDKKDNDAGEQMHLEDVAEVANE